MSDAKAMPLELWGAAVQPPALTKREWFAGLAMQGMCASPYWCENVTPAAEMREPVARLAVSMADDLIAALNAESVR